jgi:hypothetical protein
MDNKFHRLKSSLRNILFLTNNDFVLLLCYKSWSLKRGVIELKKVLLTILLIGAISLVGCGKKDKTTTVTTPDGKKITTITSPEGKQTTTVTSHDGKVMSVTTKK